MQRRDEGSPGQRGRQSSSACSGSLPSPPFEAAGPGAASPWAPVPLADFFLSFFFCRFALRLLVRSSHSATRFSR